MILVCMMSYIIFLIFSLLMYSLGLYFLSKDIELFLEFKILSLNSISIEFVLYLDWISFLFSSFVFFISSMIMKYSSEYMLMDKNMKRFIYLMIMFIISMMMVIFSLNMVSILLGWDGLGLVSYILVIYYQNMKSYNAGMLTALSNRIGDAAILISIALMMDIGSWSFMSNLQVYKMNENLFYMSMFILLAAMTKSAQIPFSSWLPAAMAAPTPVSSLVHSSTLVTAGVYLLIRFSELFSTNLNQFFLFWALLTMFMAGLAANFEFDLKKIIALSTLSQLGMMMVILCIGDKILSFFHLLIHALFKALLFMCAGVFIHSMNNCQDIRYMGGLINMLPFTCVCFNISNFALCGVPFMSGFYSKDLMVEFLSMKYVSVLVYLMFFISVGLTVSYSMRLSYYVFFGEYNYSNLNNYNEDMNKNMLNSMVGLVSLVIFKGSMLMWMIFSVPYFIMLPKYMKINTLIMIFLGIMIGYELSKMNYLYNNKSLLFHKFSLFLVNMWNMPSLSTFGLNLYILELSKVYFKKIDYGWLEYYGSKNIFFCLKKMMQILQILSSNHLKIFYLMLFIISFVLIFFIIVFV
uniref:NADH-ubiquinone oxidoreductase chain 5 n=1 Tax=Curculionidae sp. 5 AH-2016 TaxID=1903831 RepID=A0A343C4L2_9CUCU|nr:NADH dehydrogenase subunit 5 [Curculionidae sp. 5 AH-2016]